MQYRTTNDQGHSVDVWEILEMNPTSAVADLYHWSTNYDAGKGPFTLFLDIIGWSEDEIGEALYDFSNGTFGYVEVSKLAAALNEYATDPTGAYDFVQVVLQAESGELIADA